MGNIYHNKARGLVRGRLYLLLFLLVFIFSLTGLSKMSGMKILADTKYNAKYPRLVDKADVLTDEEEKKLLKKLNKISEEEKVDVVVLTVENEAGKDVTAFADDFYDYNNYGFGHKGDGIILVVDYGSRDWALSTKGKGIYLPMQGRSTYQISLSSISQMVKRMKGLRPMPTSVKSSSSSIEQVQPMMWAICLRKKVKLLLKITVRGGRLPE